MHIYKKNLTFFILGLMIVYLTGCSMKSNQKDMEIDIDMYSGIDIQEDVSTKDSVTIGQEKFTLEAWGDNRFSVYLGNELIIEDSVPITTERSFNAETTTFNGTYPMNINVVMKDFKENDTGLEYIGKRNQQMGDGGFIMQIKDADGELLAVTNDDWKCKVIHQAPLDKLCESESNPVAGVAPCAFIAEEEPDNRKSSDFDDTDRNTATVHSERAVSPKDGYTKISWDKNAEFIRGDDLETDNTILCRYTVDIVSSKENEINQADIDVVGSTVFDMFTEVSVETDDEYIYIASSGLPEHDMMVGITNRQQQIGLPQAYDANNRRQIPLNPTFADDSLSTKDNFMKGAIAIAANGVPIFNVHNNRGEDTNTIGELDERGGHAGRADDYHYHVPPVHLEEQVGSGNPIAYALDGFPLYGNTDEELDEYLGREDIAGNYGYYTIEEYPYFMPYVRGVVEVDDQNRAPENQIVPQPRTMPVRPSLTPLRGAEIVGFEKTSDNSYFLEYIIEDETYVMNYSRDDDFYTFVFTDSLGEERIETYSKK